MPMDARGFPNCIFYNTFLAGIDAHVCPRFPKLYYLQTFCGGQCTPQKCCKKYSLGIRCPILGIGFPNGIFCKHSELGGFPNCIFYKHSCAVGFPNRIFCNTFVAGMDAHCIFYNTFVAGRRCGRRLQAALWSAACKWRCWCRLQAALLSAACKLLAPLASGGIERRWRAALLAPLASHAVERRLQAAPLASLASGAVGAGLGIRGRFQGLSLASDSPAVFW